MAESKNPQEFPPFELLKPRTSLREFGENLRVVLGLGPRPKYRIPLTPEIDALTEATREPFPVRGFLYSCLLHEVVLILLIMLPPLVPAQRKRFEFDRWLPLDTHLTFNFPRLEPPRQEGGHEGGGKPGGKSGGGSPEAGADSPAPAPKEGGLVYPAPIEAVSNPPNPTNRIQTILQPDLPNPPEIKTPIPLPNVVLVKRGAPAPPPLLPKPPTVEPIVIQEPKLTLPPNIAKLLPKSLRSSPPTVTPQVKEVPAEELPPAPALAMASPSPDSMKLLRKSAAPPPLVPKVNVVASSDPAVEAPQLPIEARAPGMPTYDRGVKAPPPPVIPKVDIPNGVAGGTGNVPGAPVLSAQALASGMPGGSLPGGDPRGRGSVPPLLPKGDGVGTAGAAGGTADATSAAPNLSLPPGSGGQDDRNLLVLSPIPGSGGSIPFGEARGQFAMGPNPNLRGVPGLPPGRPDGIEGGTGTGPGDSKGTGRGGAGSGGSGTGGTGPGAGGGGGGTGTGTGPGVGSGVGPGSGTGEGSGTGTGKGPGENGTGGGGTGAGTGTGKGSGPGQGTGQGSGPGTGSGFGSGSGTGSSPFQGIYIAGLVGNKGSAAGGQGGVRHNVPPSGKTSYGMTIVSTAASGGGLRDYGIFRNEVVSTVYIEMTHSPEPAPSWTLQYALLQKDPNMAPETLVGPFPIDKEKPEFPREVVARNIGRLIVVYAEINVEGKVENTRIIQSPNPLLNSPLLEALAKWAFRPAESNGQPVAVKALLGIPLSLPPS